MLGWINDCIEKLVLHKFDAQTWHLVKDKAGLGDVKDGGFLKLETYPDNTTVDLVKAISELSSLTEAQVYEAFGEFFVPYIIDEGYHNLLCCQGSTLRDWMSNINAIHQHLQNTFPKSMTMPEFWCETNRDGSLRLFYFSTRGSFLAPLAVGLVREVAKIQFELDIVMTLVTTQGVDGSQFTSWIVETRNPDEMHKLTTTVGGSGGVDNSPTCFPMLIKCPMTGLEIDVDEIPGFVSARRRPSIQSTVSCTAEEPFPSQEFVETKSPGSKICPFHVDAQEDHDRLSISSRAESTCRQYVPGRHHGFGTAANLSDHPQVEPGGLSASVVQTIFPYHVLIDADFCIRQVGKDLPKVLGATKSILCDHEIDDIFEFVKPKPAKWTRSWLRKLQDQEFVLQCTLKSMPNKVLFKGTWVPSCGPSGMEVLLILCPDAKNLIELRELNLTLSDLPAHGAYRDAVFLREHLSRQMNNTLQMEKLSKRLQTEKNLLESLLPVHAAEGLRRGEEVKPMIHSSVTMFFSDIVGFTSICKEISPCQVIDMLNELYGIIDFLAGKFGLFKIETIGDAYVCACGLPISDENHAVNVANFAVAVQHCCRRVLSPVDNQPIQLRVGIHSGEAASGIVGVTNPRYCVFGDTVNTTARHESTGRPGKVHCSRATMMELKLKANHNFTISHRGMVEMKGKGPVPTYWVQSTEKNTLTNKEALLQLDKEISKLSLPKENNWQVPSAPSLKHFKRIEDIPVAQIRESNENGRDYTDDSHTASTLKTQESSCSDISRSPKRETLKVVEKALAIVQRGCSDFPKPLQSREEIASIVARSRKRRIEKALKQSQAILASRSKQ